jgi:uncharacterized protein with HEPN domain
MATSISSSSLTSGVTAQIPWTKIRSMRNVIAHDYAGIDATVVWETVRQRPPELRVAVEGILKRLPPG